MTDSLNEIKDEFKKVITYSQGIENPKVDKLFDRWLEAKKDFIEAFNGKLIYELPTKVSFELGEKEKNARIDDFVSSLEGRWDNYPLANFVDSMRDGFFSNMLSHPYTMNNGTVIPKGMKFVKAFKFFEEDKNLLTDIQNQASRIIQEDKIEGTLCLSVHPLDFLSTSENSFNWRSCHALDGEYRGGNLSYMVDSSTVICYLRSEHMTKLPDFPSDVLWNSKKWRVLLFFSNSWKMVFAGRQYPFESDVGIKYVLDTLLPVSNLLMQGEWHPWAKAEIKSITIESDEELLFLNDKYVYVYGYLKRINDLIVDKPNSLHFNDLLNSSCYSPIYTWKISRFPFWSSGEDNELFEIGGEVPCLRCGEDNISAQDTMMCNNCELECGNSADEIFTTCDICGCRCLSEEVIYLGDVAVCPDCVDSKCGRCETCGELAFTDELIYNRKAEKYQCAYCAQEENGVLL